MDKNGIDSEIGSRKRGSTLSNSVTELIRCYHVVRGQQHRATLLTFLFLDMGGKEFILLM